MPYSDYRPELMGSATLEPVGAFEAGSWQSFKLVYRCGRFGIDDTGSLKIGFRFATDFGPVQFEDPSAPGYTTVEASNGAELEYRWEFKRNIRPWSRALYIGVKKHFLAEGDTITIRFGDRSGGSPGVRMQTYCENLFEFRVFVDAFATYDYVPLAQSPWISIVPGPPVEWHAVLPTLIGAGEPFRMSLKANDAWGNPSNRIDARLRLRTDAAIDGLPETVAFEPGAFSQVIEGLRVSEPQDVIIDVLDEAGTTVVRSNPLRVMEAPEKLHFWGDLHGQSNETLGTNTAEEYFLFGRDRAFLDICAHQGNDFQITGAFWKALNRLTSDLDEPGRFVCIPGYEWSANTAVGGDRNVFYRQEGRPIFRSSHAQTPDPSDEDADAYDANALFKKLGSEDCVVFAHCGGRYADIAFAHHGPLETAVEVHSSWGTFEWLLHDAFRHGYRVGVVCNSDGHKGRVGASYPGASFFGALGGLTCFLAPRLDREAIFEAMRRRHHYGTTGNRMLLDVSANYDRPVEIFARDPGHGSAHSWRAERATMGDIIRLEGDALALDVEALGSAPIERVDVFDGLELIETMRPYGPSDLGRRIRIVYRGAEYRGRARATVWDGRVQVKNNEIQTAAMINNWNLDRGVRVESPATASWQAVTTGNFGAIDLWLKQAGGRLEIETPHVQTAIIVDEIGHEPQVFEAGGLERGLEVYRLPEQMTVWRVHRHLRVPLNSKKGDRRLYVRVTQEDGHRAWSSPIYAIP